MKSSPPTTARRGYRPHQTLHGRDRASAPTEAAFRLRPRLVETSRGLELELWRS